MSSAVAKVPAPVLRASGSTITDLRDTERLLVDVQPDEAGLERIFNVLIAPRRGYLRRLLTLDARIALCREVFLRYVISGRKPELAEYSRIIDAHDPALRTT